MSLGYNVYMLRLSSFYRQTLLYEGVIAYHVGRWERVRMPDNSKV